MMVPIPPPPKPIVKNVLEFEQLEKGKVYRDILSGLPVLVCNVTHEGCSPCKKNYVTGLRYNPITGNDDCFETSQKRLIKL
jgi:hypothetical protein